MRPITNARAFASRHDITNGQPRAVGGLLGYLLSAALLAALAGPSAAAPQAGAPRVGDDGSSRLLLTSGSCAEFPAGQVGSGGDYFEVRLEPVTSLTLSTELRPEHGDLDLWLWSVDSSGARERAIARGEGPGPQAEVKWTNFSARPVTVVAQVIPVSTAAVAGGQYKLALNLQPWSPIATSSAPGPGSPPPRPVFQRNLYLDRFRFRDPEGKGGNRKGEVILLSGARPSGLPFDEVLFNKYPAGAPFWKVLRSKKPSKCSDDDCGDIDDDCRWQNKQSDYLSLYTDKCLAEMWCDPVDTTLKFIDLNRSWADSIQRFGDALEALFDCLECSFGSTPLDCTLDCLTAVGNVGYSLVFLYESTFDEADHRDEIGTLRHDFPTPAWTVQPTPLCTNLALDVEKPEKRPARAEFTMRVEKLYHQGNGTDITCPPMPNGPNGAGLEETLGEFWFHQASFDEIEFFASVQGGSLLHPGNLAGTRSFQFVVDADDNWTTGDPGFPDPLFRGAEYYILIEQTYNNGAIDVTSSVWGFGAFGPWTLIPGSALSSLEILNRSMTARLRLSQLGAPNSQVAAWVIANRDGGWISNIPPTIVDTFRYWIGITPDVVCPRVKSIEADDLQSGDPTAPIQVRFSEPIDPNSLGLVAMAPATPIVVALDATGSLMTVTPQPAFPAGPQTLVIDGLLDLAGNALDGSVSGQAPMCGTPVLLDFCVPEIDWVTCDINGTETFEFLAGETIYAKGTGFAPSLPFLVMVVPSDLVGEPNAPLIDHTTTGPNVVVADAFGGLAVTALGVAVRNDEYALVADLNLDGQWQGTDRTFGQCEFGLVVGGPCISGLDNMLAWWPMDEAFLLGNTYEMMGGFWAAQLGAPTVVSGVSGNALSFAAGDGLGVIAPLGDLDFVAPLALTDEGDFTIETWIKGALPTGNLLSKLDAFSGYGLELVAGVPRLTLRDSSGTTTLSMGWLLPNDGNWHHLAVSVDRDLATGGRWYRDGAQFGAAFDPTPRSGNLTSAAPLLIAGGTFAGALDETALYEEALSGGLVSLLYQGLAYSKCVDDCNQNGVPDGIDIAAATSQDCNGNSVPDECDIASGESEDQNSNLVPDECESSPGSPYCTGDGSGTACPCGNVGNVGQGCANSAGAGAVLFATGNPSISADTLALWVNGAPGTKPGLILRGASITNGGLGIVVGDGLLCTAGQTARSHVQITAAGSTVFTNFQGQPFGAWSYGAGVNVNYQFWYRDPAGPCGGGFNFTNAWALVWLP
jgi:hypothetical protein